MTHDIKTPADAIPLYNKGLAAIASFPEYYNFLDMASYHLGYSFRNIVLIYMQLPTATYLESYSGWKRHGRYPAQNTKALRILQPAPQKSRKGLSLKEQLDDEGKVLLNVTQWPEFEILHVHDISCTTGKRLMKALIREVENGFEVPFRAALSAIMGSDNPMGSDTPLHRLISDLVLSAQELSSFESETVIYLLCKRYGIQQLNGEPLEFDTVENFAESMHRIFTAASELEREITAGFLRECVACELDPLVEVTLPVPCVPEAKAATDSPEETNDPPADLPKEPDTLSEPLSVETEQGEDAVPIPEPEDESPAGDGIPQEDEFTVSDFDDELPISDFDDVFNDPEMTASPYLSDTVNKSKIPICLYDFSSAQENGCLEDYCRYKLLTIDCVKNIRIGFLENRNESEINIGSVINGLLGIYGEERLTVTLVLAVTADSAKYTAGVRKWAVGKMRDIVEKYGEISILDDKYFDPRIRLPESMLKVFMERYIETTVEMGNPRSFKESMKDWNEKAERHNQSKKKG